MNGPATAAPRAPSFMERIASLEDTCRMQQEQLLEHRARIRELEMLSIGRTTEEQTGAVGMVRAGGGLPGAIQTAQR